MCPQGTYVLRLLTYPWVQEARGAQLLEVLDRRQAREHLGRHVVLRVQGNLNNTFTSGSTSAVFLPVARAPNA